MKGYIVEKKTGRFVYFGEVSNKPKLKGAKYQFVPSSEVKPMPERQPGAHPHILKNGKWVKDPEWKNPSPADRIESDLKRNPTLNALVTLMAQNSGTSRKDIIKSLQVAAK